MFYEASAFNQAFCWDLGSGVIVDVTSTDGAVIVAGSQGSEYTGGVCACPAESVLEEDLGNHGACTVPAPVPTAVPTGEPTGEPSANPSTPPSYQPSSRPTGSPSGDPTGEPAAAPTSVPSASPTSVPTIAPTSAPSQPSSYPTGSPMGEPTGEPTGEPSAAPSSVPSGQPTVEPTGVPSAQPSTQPSSQPSSYPTGSPTGEPSGEPSAAPTSVPSASPTSVPTTAPTAAPTSVPTSPTSTPSGQPSGGPSTVPSSAPTSEPTSPTGQPTGEPTTIFSSDVSFNATQVLRGDDLNTTALTTTSTLQYETFVATVAVLTKVSTSGISITSATATSSARRLRLRRLLAAEVVVEYDIRTTTAAMNVGSAEDVYMAIATNLEDATTSVDSGSGARSVFASTLVSQAGVVAGTLGINVAEAMGMFANVSCAAVEVAPSFRAAVARTAAPSSNPTSTPTCGAGAHSEDGSMGSGCQSCDPGYYRSAVLVHGGNGCVKCPMDSYSEDYGNKECNTCVAPAATLADGAETCDAFSLRGDIIVASFVFALLAVAYVYSCYMAGIDYANFGVLALFPFGDFVSDVVYATQVRFLNYNMFVLAIVCLFMPNLVFIWDLIRVRARPGLNYVLPLSMFWLNNDVGTPRVDGVPVILFERHDAPWKVVLALLLWGLLVVLQVLWVILYALYMILHVCVWLPIVLFAGFLLFSLKGMCVKRVYNQWITQWCGSTYVEDRKLLKTDVEKYPVDAAMMDESVVAEFILESIPELVLQAMNNYATDQWNNGQAIFSFAFTILVVLNSVYRFVYYPFVLGVSASTVPMSIPLPTPLFFCGGSAIVRFQITEPESREEKEKHLYEIADDATGHAELHKRVEKAYKEIIDYTMLCLVRNDFIAHMIVMELIFAKGITSPAGLAKCPATVRLLHDIIGKSGRNIRFLSRCPNLEDQLQRFTRTYTVSSAVVEVEARAGVWTFFKNLV